MMSTPTTEEIWMRHKLILLYISAIFTVEFIFILYQFMSGAFK